MTHVWKSRNVIFSGISDMELLGDAPAWILVGQGNSRAGSLAHSGAGSLPAAHGEEAPGSECSALRGDAISDSFISLLG